METDIGNPNAEIDRVPNKNFNKAYFCAFSPQSRHRFLRQRQTYFLRLAYGPL